MSNLEALLLTVSSGAGVAPIQVSVVERYGAPAPRFVPLAGDQPAITTAVGNPPSPYWGRSPGPSTENVGAGRAITIVPAHPVRQLVPEGNRA